MTFDVSVRGEIAFPVSETEAPVIKVVDSTGRRLAEFGEIGEGPGEMGWIANIAVLGDTILIHTGEGNYSLLETTLTGKLLRQRRVGTTHIVLAWHRDSIDHWDPQPYPGVTDGGLRVTRSAVGERAGRSLIDSTQPLFASAIPDDRRNLMVFSLPFAATADRFWIGDQWNYRIGVFTNEGQSVRDFTHPLPPNRRGPRANALIREMILNAPKFYRGPNGERMAVRDQSARLDTLDREIIPHFAYRPLHIDHNGRLWVVAASRDSTSVDVFSDTTFLGRTMLPCFTGRSAGRSAVGPGWLVLECEVDDSDWPTELQLYRIVER